MKIVYGPIPPSNTLHPPFAGWTALRELTPGRSAMVAILLALPLIAAAILTLQVAKNDVRALFADHPATLVGFVLALIAIVPVHEAIHALAYLKDVRSNDLLAGV